MKKERLRIIAYLQIGADDEVAFRRHVNALASDGDRRDWLSASARRYLAAFAKRREVLSASIGKQMVLDDFSEKLPQARVARWCSRRRRSQLRIV